VVAVRLLLYSATVGAHDLIFGFPIGRSLELLYPNGQRATHELRGRQLVLNALPRGTYRIKVHTWGYSPVVSLALSKDQELELRIVSYLDLFVIALAVLGVTGTLVLLPRPALRKSLRALAVQAARVAVSRVAALARWARGACGRDGPVRRTSSRFLAFLGTGGVEPETVADDLDVATPSEEAQTNIAPRLPRWVPLPLDAPDPRSPQSSLFPSRLRAFPAAAVRYARNVAASGLSLSKPAATRSAEVARVPPGGRWAAPTLEVPVRAASSSPTVAPDAVVRYIRELISSGQTVPTRGLRRFRAEGGQIRTELWFELFESITRELAALNDTPDVSRPLAGPMRAAIRYQIASGERR
jgi:hypothetical protein